MYVCIYAHTYVHTAKRCLDPPRTTLQFTHALHTATSTSAIICIPDTVLYMRIEHQALHAYTCKHACIQQTAPFYCERARSFGASECEVSVQARTSNTLELARSETLLSQRSFEYARSVNCTIFTVSVRKVLMRACAKFQCERARAYLNLRCKRT